MSKSPARKEIDIVADGRNGLPEQWGQERKPKPSKSGKEPPMTSEAKQTQNPVEAGEGPYTCEALRHVARYLGTSGRTYAGIKKEIERLKPQRDGWVGVGERLPIPDAETIRLHAGEIDDDTMMTVKAVLIWYANSYLANPRKRASNG